jgi:hypothetical protein
MIFSATGRETPLSTILEVNMLPSIKISAQLISARALPSAIADAVKLAEERVPVGGTTGPIVVKWDLIGRILRDSKMAFEFADAVSSKLNEGGMKVEPAVLIQKKIIIAGFFERKLVPQIREL